MICDHCENGLGTITLIEQTQVRTYACPACEGIGVTCPTCLGNPVHCSCGDKGPPPRANLPSWIPKL